MPTVSLSTAPCLPCASYPAQPEVHTLLEQGSGICNEDALLASHPLYAVMDGASSLCGTGQKGKSGAWWAAHIARDTLRHCAADSAHMTPGTMVRHANNAIRRAMDGCGIDTSDPLRLWSTSLAAIRLQGGHMQYAQIGDCLILCITDDGHFLPVPHHNHDRESLCLWQQACRNGVQDVRRAMHDHLCAVRRQMNRHFGALNGQAEAEGFIREGSVPLHGIRRVVLFTDGLHIPSASPEADDDFSRAAALLRTGGLHALHHHVRETERTDPDCRVYPRFKPHDDSAAILLQFS